MLGLPLVGAERRSTLRSLVFLWGKIYHASKRITSKIGLHCASLRFTKHDSLNNKLSCLDTSDDGRIKNCGLVPVGQNVSHGCSTADNLKSFRSLEADAPAAITPDTKAVKLIAGERCRSRRRCVYWSTRGGRWTEGDRFLSSVMPRKIFGGSILGMPVCVPQQQSHVDSCPGV